MTRLPWSLAELIAPLSVADFREHYWGKRAFATQIPTGALAWLRSELDDFVPERLVRRYRGQLAIWFKTLEGEQRVAAATNAEDALALYHAGKTVFMLNGAATPSIIQWERALADAAGHPPTPLTASLFLSRRSASTAMHFDMLENFTIQLSGHKRWRVAPNPHVRNALENWAVRQAVSPSLGRMLDSPLPEVMPADAENFDLKEGTLLYIPRGHFHETDAAGEESVSLFLGMPLATWTDLLLDGLRDHLDRLPHWRENIIGGSSPDRVLRSRERLDELRAGLAKDLEGLSTEFLLPHVAAPIDDARTMRRNPFAVVTFATGTINIHLNLGKIARRNSFPAPPLMRTVLDWFLARESFVVADALAAHPHVPRGDMLELVGALQGAGLFT